MCLKKIISILCFAIAILATHTVFCGSIPEDLMHEDGAQIFFAEILSYSKENSTVTVCPVKKIKGDVKIGTQKHYDRASTVGDFVIKQGNVYLFTYFDENNPTEIFEVTSYDTSTLKIKNIAGDMWERFEKYLNDGKYEKTEQDRINKINAKFTKVGDEITLSSLTETNNEKCYKVEIGILGNSKVYEIDKNKFYKISDAIKLVDIDNVLVTNPENGLVVRCYEGKDLHEITLWDNCKVAGSRVSMNSAPIGDYIIKAEDFDKLISLLPEDAHPKLPPIKNLYANFMYWFIYNSKTAYNISILALIGCIVVAVILNKYKRKSK